MTNVRDDLSSHDIFKCYRESEIRYSKKMVQTRSQHNISKSEASKRTITSECLDGKLVKRKRQSIAGFEDLPDEILLIICRYLTPRHVLNAFNNYNDRLFRCIADYRTKIDLTQCSYVDYQYFLVAFKNGRLLPSTLILSNEIIPTQITTFFKTCASSIISYIKCVHRLSLLQCKQSDIFSIGLYIGYFTCLQFLRIVESVPEKAPFLSMDYSTIETLRKVAFDNRLNALTELELTTVEGIILDKQVLSNKSLKQLTISLQTIDDLLVLLDGLMPNLTTLNVTLCKSSRSQRLVLPHGWPRRLMSHLALFRLTTGESVKMQFDHLRSLVMPLSRLETLVLDIKQWASDENCFVQGTQIEMMINKFIPRLQNFHCCIQTMADIDMRSFEELNKRWPLVCGGILRKSRKYLYSVPWSFEKLSTSMLADDDTSSVCPTVQILTVDAPCTNVARRFPNVHTLIIPSKEELCRDDYRGFHRLRHLTSTNMRIVPLFSRNVDTLTFLGKERFWTQPTIYPNVYHLALENLKVSQMSTVKALVQHFPNIRSLKMFFRAHQEYYDSLNVLLDGRRLPHLKVLKTNWIEKKICYTDTNTKMWLNQNTILKWKSALFYGHYDDGFLTICV